jgi:hypothetical protein
VKRIRVTVFVTFEVISTASLARAVTTDSNLAAKGLHDSDGTHNAWRTRPRSVRRSAGGTWSSAARAASLAALL